MTDTVAVHSFLVIPFLTIGWDGLLFGKASIAHLAFMNFWAIV